MARIEKDKNVMYNSPFAIALRTLMSEKPITTQAHLAEITGKTRQTVSQYVNGISEPSYDTLVKIADYFDVSVDYLLGRTKDRRREASVYDSIGLTEENITALRLACSAKQDDAQLNKFISFLYGQNWECPKPPELYAPSEIENYDSTFFSKIQLICDVLPDITNLIITIATEQGYSEIIAQDFAQLFYQECRPSGLDQIMPLKDFIRFKAAEIADAIKHWIIYNSNEEADIQ